jgi:hypothetical protein
VVKLAPNGRSVAYGTYLGGTSTDDAFGIAVDGAGAAYVAGQTSSTNLGFGGAPGFDQSFNGGLGDAFVVSLVPDGHRLAYGTYLGGMGNDRAEGVAVDGSGAAYIVGTTDTGTLDFAGAPGFDQVFNSGISDAFVVKLTPGGGSLVYGTYLGGDRVDSGAGIAVDGTGAAYVVGRTNSSTFGFGGAPGHDQSLTSGADGTFVVKLVSDGRSLAYGTFLGGTGNGIAVNGRGSAYVVGYDTSGTFDFAGAPGFDQSFNGGLGDGFMAKLPPDGRSLTYGTYLGGTITDNALGIALDGAGAAYVAGQTSSRTLELGGAPGFDQPRDGTSDAFAVKLFAVACDKRPPVGVLTSRTGDGRLQVDIRANTSSTVTSNQLQGLSFTQLANAIVEVEGLQVRTPASVSLPSLPQSVTFFVRRATTGRTTIVQFEVTDGCPPPWKSFVGGGASSF